MALTKNQKNDVVSEVSDLLSSSKMTVVAKFQGTTVKALQGYAAMHVPMVLK
jgi:ribosomal protein L10